MDCFGRFLFDVSYFAVIQKLLENSRNFLSFLTIFMFCIFVVFFFFKHKIQNITTKQQRTEARNVHELNDDTFADTEYITDEYGNDYIRDGETGETISLQSRRGMRELLKRDKIMSDDVKFVMYFMRERYMLREMVNNDCKKIVAVVGIAHLDGFETMWFDDELWNDKQFWMYETGKVIPKKPSTLTKMGIAFRKTLKHIFYIDSEKDMHGSRVEKEKQL